jgi:hypothetical protein
VAVDAAGAVYVCGYTASTNFPVTNAFQTSLNTGLPFSEAPFFDAFLVKLAPGGTQTVYSTFVGGEGHDFCYRMAADNAGNAFLAGWGNSAQFPPTNAFAFVVQTNVGTNVVLTTDAFVVSVGPAGSLLNAARYGGTGDDRAVDIRRDAAGNVFVAGFTTSPEVPILGATQPQNRMNAGFTDAFVFSLSPDLATLRYSLMLGGNVDDFAFGMDVEANGLAYVVGKTASLNFPTTGGLQPVFAGGVSDAFVARVLIDPPLTVRIAGSGVDVSWPAPAPGFRLQLSQQSPDGAWLDLLPQPTLTNGTYHLSLPSLEGPAYFRLIRP